MSTFRERKKQAQRKALDLLPAEKRPALMLHGAKHKRCGECQACCEVQRIGELSKPAYQKCPHQCELGCDVHASKPAECAHYECGFLLGVLTGGEEMRPDMLGLLIDFRPSIDENGVELNDGETLIGVWETRAGAALEQWDLLARILELKHNTILVPWDAHQLDDGHRVDHIRLYTSVYSQAPDGLFNVKPVAKSALKEVLHERF